MNDDIEKILDKIDKAKAPAVIERLNSLERPLFDIGTKIYNPRKGAGGVVTGHHWHKNSNWDNMYYEVRDSEGYNFMIPIVEARQYH